MKEGFVHFMYVGRLSPEKGLLYLLELIKQIAGSPLEEKFHLHIFGKGSLQQEIQQVDNDYEFITYYGHQPKETVFETWKTCSYTLMYSTFLETFGLVALDSLAVGVPVLGFRKGGLIPFLLDERSDVMTFTGASIQEKIWQQVNFAIDHANTNTRKEWSKNAHSLYENYLPEKRVERFQELSGLKPGSTVWFVSDYAYDMGGIENFLFFAKDLLEKAGYTVEYFGYPRYLSPKIRYVYLLTTLWNVSFARLLRKKHKKAPPDLIWRHSVHRRVGRYPLRVFRNSQAIQWCMYHDFGLFHPFPQHVDQVSQLNSSSTFGGYMKEGFQKGWYRLPLLIFKRCSARIVKGLLARSMKKHLVPSPYMEEIVCNGLAVEKGKVVTFPHFVKK